MKKLITKVIIIAVIAMMAIALCGFRYYTEDEAPAALIKELATYGFEISEEDDDVWTYDGIMDGCQVLAVFDTYYNMGSIYAVNLETGERALCSFTWDCDSESFDTTAEWEEIFD